MRLGRVGARKRLARMSRLNRVMVGSPFKGPVFAADFAQAGAVGFGDAQDLLDAHGAEGEGDEDFGAHVISL